ncbi:MAG: hypothetical protein AAFX79_09105 [Planctomycetota bacterium]
MSFKRSAAGVGVVGLGCMLGGCAATGLTPEALEITKAECQATITHLSNTEPEFDGLVESSHAWAVFPGDFNILAYFLGGGGGDGLVYDNSGEVIGYSRHARINLGIGAWGGYEDFVLFFPTEEALADFQEGGWSVGGNAGWGILGLAASGQTSFNRDMTMVSDPRAGSLAAVHFTFDNFSYNDIDDAMGN